MSARVQKGRGKPGAIKGKPKGAAPGQGTSAKAIARRQAKSGVKITQRQVNTTGKNIPLNFNKKKGGKKDKFSHVKTSRGIVDISKKDFRNTGVIKNANSNVLMSNTQSAIQFDLAADFNVFSGPAMSIVCYALQKNWEFGSENPNNPYYAFVYLANLIQSAALNAIPQAVMVPRCIAYIMQALVEKKIPAMGGSASFKFTFQQSLVSGQYDIGPNGIANWNLFVFGLTQINTLFYVGVANPTYTPEAGATAWTSLLQFLASVDGDNPMMQLVSPSEVNKMTKDASAFAVVIANPGCGFDSCGGFGSTKSLEVAVRSPLFSCFYNNPNNTDDTNRYPRFIVSGAGDGLWLGAIASLYKSSQLSVKAPPVFKCYDLNEFIEVYAMVLLKAMNLLLSDPQVSLLVTEFGTLAEQQNVVNSYMCPLTLLEFALLMRATCMSAVKDTQPFVQALAPRLDTPTDNLFCALTCCANTCALPGATSMQIPLPLVENIKSMTYAVIEGDNPRNPMFGVPILGIYPQDLLLSSDYVGTSTFGSGSVINWSLFAPNQPNPISLVDGTTIGDTVVFINDPAALNTLTEKFNTWLKGDNSISNFIVGMTTVSTDGGVNILTGNNVTSYWVPAEVGGSVQERRDFYAAKDIYDRLKSTKEGTSTMTEPVPNFRLSGRQRRFGFDHKDRVVNTSPYLSRNVIDYSFRYAPPAPVWEGVQQYWILPVIDAEPDNTVAGSNQVLRIAAQQSEFNQLIVTSTNNPYTLAEKHSIYAAGMTGGRNSERGGEMMRTFKTLADRGQGGIFNDLVSAFNSAAQLGMVVAPIAARIMPV